MENNVTKNLATLLENNVATIQKHKRVVHKLQQDNESAKHKHQVNPVPFNHIKPSYRNAATNIPLYVFFALALYSTLLRRWLVLCCCIIYLYAFSFRLNCVVLVLSVHRKLYDQVN